MTVDDFSDEARFWILLALRDSPFADKMTFAEGYKFASDLSVAVAGIYKRNTKVENDKLS